MSLRIRCVFLSLFIIGNLFLTEVKSQTPVLRYAFNQVGTTDSIYDETGNGCNALMVGSAQLKRMGTFNALSIGAEPGYVDMTSKVGNIVKNLSNFTISTYLYVDSSVNLFNNGNFVWTFSRSEDIEASATGCLFYSAKNSRYAICSTNWSTEKSVGLSQNAAQGSWKHITYVQSGTTGAIYVNGVLSKSGTVNLLPSTLGPTDYNYLCKSSYGSDQLLLNSMLYDFRIYNSALTGTQIASLATRTAALDTVTYKDLVDTAFANLNLGDLSAVAANLNLPATGSNNTTITWNSSNPAVISNLGVVVRPANGSNSATVVLTATIAKNFVSETKTFTATVIPSLSDQDVVLLDSNNLTLSGNLTNLRSNLTLPSGGAEGSTVTWSSSNTAILSNAGAIVTRPAHGSGNAAVVMTATIKKGSVTTTKTFNVSVAEDEGFSAYLFAYFTGNSIWQEAIRFALSDNGYNYAALNGNNSIINSADISSTGGVRDPHILRGENNDYYMVATDMVSANGWNSNRAMVLLKSTNLTDWQHSIINIPDTYPQYSAADRVWAPETIYDPSVGKYMVYFSMRLGPSDYDKIYYAYANDRFLGFESAPKLLFDNSGKSTIDGDIVYKDGKYHLFFKTEGNGNGIKKAVSDKLTGNYVLFDKYLQSTSNAVEGGCVFRMYNSDNWMLIYDMYTSGAYQFTTSTDLENFSVVSQNVSFDFTPRHGTIIPITSKEKNALLTKWGSSGVESDLKDAVSVSATSASGSLHVQISGDEDASGFTLRLFDMLGKKVLEKKHASQSETMDVSRLSPGIYILNVLTNNHILKNQKIRIN